MQEARGDVQGVVAIEDPDFGGFGGRRELDRLDLMEVVDQGGSAPDFLIEDAVYDRRGLGAQHA